MSEPDYKKFYDVMMRLAQDWEDLAVAWGDSSGGYALRAVVGAIASVSETYTPNAPIANLIHLVREG